MPALPLSDKMVESVAQRFRLLGEPMRLRILQILEQGERTVSEIVAAIDGNQPNISSHLRALWDGGLLKRRRSGTSRWRSAGSASPIGRTGSDKTANGHHEFLSVFEGASESRKDYWLGQLATGSSGTAAPSLRGSDAP